MFHNITLEMSLKPFKQMTDIYITEVMNTVFEQWRPLVKEAEVISILLWTADGSEILEYKGNHEEEIEWCYLVGGANQRDIINTAADPKGLGLHSRNYTYMENPPVITYADLKKIIRIIKETGKKQYPDKLIQVGETFDPGPEFAKSAFKYEKHNEICIGESMGKSSMVCSYSLLHEDGMPYAGFPEGIPEGTPFGTFFGKQCQEFLTDMGFDYLWLSNGLGFGTETWSTTGAVFDGEKFVTEKLIDVRQKVLDFWKLFRKECPDFPLETRGTNMTAGIDYATDGVPLNDIYTGGFNLLPPPNSPWAALDGDFGLELTGYMSRLAELPSDNFLFRYYIHDPWWANSPWYDRYEGQPHDIYLPMAIGRLDEKGQVHSPTHLNILTIDNSFGEMPEACVNEPIPHILKAEKDRPDEPSPFVWVYPFEEYMSGKEEETMKEMFAGDWFIRGAINNGFPLSSVISTGNFVKCDFRGKVFKNSIIVTPVPKKDSPFEETILAFLEEGGKVIFYGGVTNAGRRFLERINIELCEGVSGKLTTDFPEPDIYLSGEYPQDIIHRELTCAGPVNTVLKNPAGSVKAFASCGGKVTAAADSSFVWIRGTVSSSYEKGSKLLRPDNSLKYRLGEVLMRAAAGALGYEIQFIKQNPGVKSPVIMIHKSDNAYMFSSYCPDTTVDISLKFPLGAPVLLGYETCFYNGRAVYRFPRAEHRECRVFVEQKEGIVSAREIPPVSYQMRRRIMVSGLKDALVRFIPEKYCGGRIEVVLNSLEDNYFVGEDFDGKYIEDKGYYEACHVTGNIVFSMPRV